VSTESFMRPGAVDLSGLAERSRAPAATGGNGAVVSDVVVDVSDATFEAIVLETSLTVPVVIDLWAEWCGPCKQLSPILEKLAREYDGRILLAKVDVDANPQLSTVFQVQSIPSVFAVLKGQPVPLFQGAIPEAQVRQVLDQLLQVAATNGVSGQLEVKATTDGSESGAPAAGPAHDPRYDAAADAIEKGDLAAAADAYRSMLAESPADPDAKAGLAQVELLRRIEGVDARAALAVADQDPADVDAQLLAADVDLAGGRVDEALTRLVDTVRRVSGDDRERVRSRLLELFEVIGSADPRVAKARSALASALF
jgi:putative thioredoxin